MWPKSLSPFVFSGGCFFLKSVLFGCLTKRGLGCRANAAVFQLSVEKTTSSVSGLKDESPQFCNRDWSQLSGSTAVSWTAAKSTKALLRGLGSGWALLFPHDVTYPSHSC